MRVQRNLCYQKEEEHYRAQGLNGVQRALWGRIVEQWEDRETSSRGVKGR